MPVPSLSSEQRQRLALLLLDTCTDRDLLALIYMTNADTKRHANNEAMVLVMQYCEAVAAESSVIAADPAHANLRDKAMENATAYQNAAAYRREILAGSL